MVEAKMSDQKGISRRDFLRAAGLTIGCLLFGLDEDEPLRRPLFQRGSTLRPVLAERPWNIVLIMTDDQRWDTLCGGEGQLSEICQLPIEERPMPTIENLMTEGVVFTNAFVTAPICCPSRASLISGGYYAHHTNVLENGWPNGGAAEFADTVTIGTLLQDRGYKTAIIGKYLNQYHKLWGGDEPYIPPGWDNFTVRVGEALSSLEEPYYFVIGSSSSTEPGTGVVETIDDGTYITDYIREKALDFIDEICQGQGCDSPFFLFFTPEAPHRPAIPPPRHADLFSDFIYRERGWGEQPDGNVSDKPIYVQRAAESWIPDEEDELYRNQLRSLRAVDEAISAIIMRLEEKHLLEETVFIITSDNGVLWGEHKLTNKMKPYEECIRVPLIVKIPGIEPRNEEKLVSVDLDVAPTVLELAGVRGVGSDGMSLWPLIVDPDLEWRHELLIQQFGRVVPTWAAIRTDDNWKYVEYVTGERELYDLGEDPFELNSKHGEPEYENIMADLARRLQGLGRGLAITRDNLPNPQTYRLPTGVPGQPYSFQLGAWGGNGDYTWSLHIEQPACGQALPPGLELAEKGVIAGTPSQAVRRYFCLKVEDTSESPQPGNDRPQSHIERFSLDTSRKIIIPQVMEGQGLSVRTTSPIQADAQVASPIPPFPLGSSGYPFGSPCLPP